MLSVLIFAFAVFFSHLLLLNNECGNSEMGHTQSAALNTHSSYKIVFIEALGSSF